MQKEDRTRLWTARHKLYYAGINMRPGTRGVSTDACVPISKMPKMITDTREDIDRMGITGKLNYKSLLGHLYKTFLTSREAAWSSVGI